MSDAIDVADRKQLFLDDELVASNHDVVRTFHRPHMTGEVLLQIDQPWEAGAHLSLYASVLVEDGRFRVWYGVESERLRHISYAESDDGLHFQKPILNLHEMGGTKANNVVLPEPVAGGAPFIDPHAEVEAQYRTFVKAYPGWPDAPQGAEFRSYASPDGLAWTRQPVEPIGDCDTQHVAFWDESVGRYVLYTRRWTRFEDKHQSFRSVRRLESDDLVHWEDTGVVWQAEDAELAARPTHTGQPALDYYGAAVFRYPDAEGPYVGLAEAYWHWLARSESDRWGESGDPQRAVIERLRPAAMDVQLLYSRDGRQFQCAPGRDPFMALGPAGRFDSRMVWAMPRPVPVGEELWIYYIGTNTDHDGFVDPESTGPLSGMSRAVMRLDGFASMDAGLDGGELVTPAMRFEGAELELNLETSGGGCVRVEVQDEAGEPLEGLGLADSVPLCTNSTRAAPRWRGGVPVGRQAGQPVRLRFVLLDAHLYAFRFTGA